MFSVTGFREAGHVNPNGGTYQQYANRQEAFRGNAPGFPNEFRYLDGVDGRINTNQEYIDIRPEGAYDIHQTAPQQPIYGDYAGGMVPDLPFDQKTWDLKRNLWGAVGLGCILVGAIIYSKSL